MRGEKWLNVCTVREQFREATRLAAIKSNDWMVAYSEWMRTIIPSSLPLWWRRWRWRVSIATLCLPINVTVFCVCVFGSLTTPNNIHLGDTCLCCSNGGGGWKSTQNLPPNKGGCLLENPPPPWVVAQVLVGYIVPLRGLRSATAADRGGLFLIIVVMTIVALNWEKAVRTDTGKKPPFLSARYSSQSSCNEWWEGKYTTIPSSSSSPPPSSTNNNNRKVVAIHSMPTEIPKPSRV